MTRKAVVSDGGHRWSGWAGPFWDHTGASEWVGDRLREQGLLRGSSGVKVQAPELGTFVPSLAE